MQIINPTTFYDKLITTGDQALYSYNNVLDDNNKSYNILGDFICYLNIQIKN